MADHDLIARHLAELRRSLRWHPDADGILDEAADHLHEAAERLRRGGADATTAQALAVARFGHGDEVARSFATTASGGLAMPTPLTRTTGTIGLLAAAGWLAAAAALLVRGADALASWDLLTYLVVAGLTTVSAALSLLVLCGLLDRSGGLRGALALATVGVGLVAAVALGALTWAWPLGGVALGVAAGLTVWRLRSTGTRSARLDWVAAAAWPVGVGVVALLSWMEMGPVDEYGDHWVASTAGFVTGAVLFAVALGRFGLWLRSEEPADLVPAVPAG